VLRVPRGQVTGSDTAIAGDAKVVVVGNETMTRKVKSRWSHTGRGGGALSERSQRPAVRGGQSAQRGRRVGDLYT
jgi:hypothetical protein